MKIITRKFFVDPILNEIQFDNNQNWMLDLINTPEFQRLKRIKQLGNTDQIFPSASHTRIAHCLGTFEIARRFVSTLGLSKKYPKEVKVILCSALLHDLGHGPNSHAFESYTGIKHEVYTKKIILDKTTQINKVLLKNKVNPQEVVDVLFRKAKYHWMYDLIDSQIDADRMDYLMRDSFFTSASYGEMNSSIIIRNAKIINQKICFSMKSVSEIVNLLIGRYHMYKQVYSHPDAIKNSFVTSQIFTRVKDLYKCNYDFKDSFKLLNLFKPWLEDKPFSLNEFFKLDDASFLTFIESLKQEKDSILKKLLIAYDNNPLIQIKEIKKSEVSSVKKTYFVDVWEVKKCTLYHSDKDVINIYDEDNNVHELSKVSEIINKLKDNTEELYYLIKID